MITPDQMEQVDKLLSKVFTPPFKTLNGAIYDYDGNKLLEVRCFDLLIRRKGGDSEVAKKAYNDRELIAERIAQLLNDTFHENRNQEMHM